MLTRLSATVVAFCLLLGGMASAASLSGRLSTPLFSGSMDYDIDIPGGYGVALGATDDLSQDFWLDGFFDAGTQGENPDGVVLSLSDAVSFDLTIEARGLVEVEVGQGFLALLFADLTGPAAGSFTGGQLLAILSDPAFPAVTGSGSFELRRLDDLGVIPLPAAAPLLLSGLGILVAVRRRRTASAH